MKDSLSVVLPVHNEVESLSEVIASWHEILKTIPNCSHTFILCEDGSTDGTKELIIKLAEIFPIINLSTPCRRGYGNAILAGIEACVDGYILCIDSDGQCPPEIFKVFWEKRHQADFIMGWRHPRSDPWIRLLYSKMFFLWYKFLFPTALHDPSCPYLLGKKSGFLLIKAYLCFLKEGFWWGFVGACYKKNQSIFEIKIKHESRKKGKTRVYYVKKMPGIIYRNVIGLLKLKFSNL